MNRHTLFILALTAVLTSSGCGPGEFQYASLHDAHGTLKINGVPAEGAMLIFVPKDAAGIDARGTRPHAVVDALGHFQVSTYGEGDGIPQGEYGVGIIWEDKPNSSSSWDKLGGQFVSPDKTGITISVSDDENELDPIVLDNVKLADRPAREAPTDADGIE